jgi:hypothetical protein
LVFKFFGEVCLNYMTSVKAGYLLKALTGKSKNWVSKSLNNCKFSGKSSTSKILPLLSLF